MPELDTSNDTPGQHCARWLRSAKDKAKETNTVLTWPEVAKIIDSTLTGLNYFNHVKPPSQEASPSPVKAQKSDDPTPESIYAAYPRKVGRKAAIDAINRALKRKSVAGGVFEASKPSHLLDATKAFSEAVAKWPADERNFCPHPATWFNQGRYDDDPKEWLRGKSFTMTPPKDYSKLG